MTKIITSSNINFGAVDEFASKKVAGVIENDGTERVIISELNSSKDEFIVNSFKKNVEATLHGNATIYFVDANLNLQNPDGSCAITDQGFGQAGTTDSLGRLTVSGLPTKTITGLTTSPTSPTVSIDFEFSGNSTFLVGKELILESVQSGNVAWIGVGVATVQPDGSWSKSDCQIAVADSYKLRARYGTEVYSSLLDVVVTSGVFAIQFGGTADDITLAVEKIGTDYYVSGATQSTTLFGEATGRLADYRLFLVKLNSAGVKQWIVFGANDCPSAHPETMVYDSATNKLYWVSQNRYTNDLTTKKVSRVALDGTVEATCQPLDSVVSQILSISVIGSIVRLAIYRNGNAYQGAFVANFNAATNVSSYIDVSTGAGANKIPYAVKASATHNFLAMTNLTPESGYITRLKQSDSSLTFSATTSYGFKAIAISATRVLILTEDGTNVQVKMYDSSLTLLYTQNIDTKTADFDSNIEFDGTSFVLVRKDATDSKFTVYEIADADTYSATTRDITQDSGTMESYALATTAEDVIAGSIDGKIDSSSTDAGGIDCFIYDES